MLIDWMLVCVKCILVHPLICGLICSLCKDTVCIKIRYIDKICFHASSVWMGCDQNLSRCLLIRFGSHDDFLHGFTCDKGVCFLFMYVFIFNFEVITSFNVIKGHERKKVLSIKLAWWVKKKNQINKWLTALATQHDASLDNRERRGRGWHFQLSICDKITHHSHRGTFSFKCRHIRMHNNAVIPECVRCLQYVTFWDESTVIFGILTLLSNIDMQALPSLLKHSHLCWILIVVICRRWANVMNHHLAFCANGRICYQFVLTVFELNSINWLINCMKQKYIGTPMYLSMDGAWYLGFSSGLRWEACSAALREGKWA